MELVAHGLAELVLQLPAAGAVALLEELAVRVELRGGDGGELHVLAKTAAHLGANDRRVFVEPRALGPGDALAALLHHAAIETREPALGAVKLLQAAAGDGGLQLLGSERKGAQRMGDLGRCLDQLGKEREQIGQGRGFLAQVAHRFPPSPRDRAAGNRRARPPRRSVTPRGMARGREGARSRRFRRQIREPGRAERSARAGLARAPRAGRSWRAARRARRRIRLARRSALRRQRRGRRAPLPGRRAPA